MTNTNNILVVKLGGGEGLNLEMACADLAEIARHRALVIVHGVSAMMNQLCEERNVPIKTLTSPSGHESRYTTPETRDLYTEAANRVNQEIVANLQAQGIPAISLTNEETVIHGERKQAIRAIVDGRVRIVRDDYSGSISHVTVEALLSAIEDGYIPVIPPMAMSEDGLLNVDGDRASAALAGALHAEELIILSNVRGLFANFPDENSFVSLVTNHEINNALDWAQGRMKRKVLGAQEALEGGVHRVIIGDGRIADPIQHALAGHGTVFTL